MKEQEAFHAQVIGALLQVKGILAAEVLSDVHRAPLLALESEAEKHALMGLGKVINSGVQSVLARDRVYVALTNMDFDWGRHPSLILKKGDTVVGEEVHDKDVLQQLRARQDVWFMHDNFVIYKDRISFPKDLAAKDCHFEIPSIKAAWLEPYLKGTRPSSFIYANPAAPCDLYLKEQYFQGIEGEGLGTIFIAAVV